MPKGKSPKPAPGKPTYQGSTVRPEQGGIKPARPTYPGTERPADLDAQAKTKETYAGNVKIDDLRQERTGRDTHPGTDRLGEPKSKDTYPGTERLEEVDRPGKETHGGSERVADLEIAAQTRALKTKETCTGAERIEDLEAPAAPAVRKPKPARPTFQGEKPFEPEAGEVPAGTRLVCPACEAGMKLKAAARVGLKVKCPKCSQPIVVEQPEPTDSQPAPAAGPAVEDWAGADFLKAAALPVTRPAAVEAPEKEKPAPAAEKKPLPLKTLLVGGGVVLLAGLLFLIFNPFGGGGGIGPDVPDSAWIAFTPPGGHCQLDMPGVPELQPAASKGASREFQVQRPERNSLFSITYIEVPGATTFTSFNFEEICRVEREQAAASVAGAIRSDRRLEWRGHQTREFVAVSPTGRMAAQRIIWIEGPSYSRLYLLTARGNWDDVDQGSPARFFASLKLPPRGMGMARQ